VHPPVDDESAETTASASSAALDHRGGRRAGRPFDRSRDAEILAHTLDALAERAYDDVTLDAIALRAGRAKTTLYRRWPSKEDLVLAALHAAGQPPEGERLPEQGSLRADLIATIDSPWMGGVDRRMAIFASLASAGRDSPRLADAVRTRIAEPYVTMYEALLRRAANRGELPPSAQRKISLLAQVIPAMSTQRLDHTHEPVARGYFVSIVDDIVLPALTAPG